MSGFECEGKVHSLGDGISPDIRERFSYSASDGISLLCVMR